MNNKPVREKGKTFNELFVNDSPGVKEPMEILVRNGNPKKTSEGTVWEIIPLDGEQEEKLASCMFFDLPYKLKFQ